MPNWVVKKDPDSIPIWQVIIGKYHPTFVGECRNAIMLASGIVKNWLATGMFEGDATAAKKGQLFTRSDVIIERFPYSPSV
ncbi:MAG: hypothetical protein PHG96_10830 [Kiritimatiellae bacterium]|nr:hypothetical protein [Kiritimatiellia bacterium]